MNNSWWIGINDLEMQDLLSLDDEVLTEVFQYTTPHRIQRLPIHVWYRLKYILKDLTVEKTFHCIAWYHRQLWEAAEQRYSSEKLRIHRLFAIYFSNKVDTQLIENRMITRQPLSLNPFSIWSSRAKLNERRIQESTYHLLRGEMLTEAIEHSFCNIEMIYATTLLHDGFYFLTLFTELKRKIQSSMDTSLSTTTPSNEMSVQISSEQRQQVDHYYLWLSREMGSIQRDPKQFLIATARAEPIISIVRRDLSTVLGRARAERPQQPLPQQLQQQHPPLLRQESKQLHQEFKYDIDVITFNGKSDFEPVLLNGKEHGDFIKTISWNPNDSLLATGSTDKTIKIWNSLTGEVLHTLSGHNSFVSVVQWHPQRPILATGSWDCSIKIWDAVTGRLQHDIEGFDTATEKYNTIPKGDHLLEEMSSNTNYWRSSFSFDGHFEQILSLQWHHQGKFLLSMAKDGMIKSWNPLTWTPFYTLFYQRGKVESLTLNHISSHFVTRTHTSLQLWDLREQEEGKKPIISYEVDNVIDDSDDGKRNAIAWSRNDRMIASGCNDGRVKIWQIVPQSNILSPLTVFRGHDRQTHVYSVDWASDDLHLASGGEDKRVLVWNYQTLDILFVFADHLDFITHVSWNHSGSILASISYDKTLKLWDAERKPSAISKASTESRSSGHEDEVLSVGYCLNPLDGTESLYSVSKDGIMIKWDISSTQIIDQFLIKKGGFHDFTVLVVPMIWSFVPSLPPLFAFTIGETVIVWDLSQRVNGKLFQLFLSKGKIAKEIKSIAWNPQRTFLSAVIVGAFSDEIDVWDIAELLNPNTRTAATVSDWHFPRYHLEGNFLAWHPHQLGCSAIINRNAIQIKDQVQQPVTTSTVTIYSFKALVWNHSGDAFALTSTTGEIVILSSSTLEIINHFQDSLPLQHSSDSSFPILSGSRHFQFGQLQVDWNRKGDRLVSTSNHLNLHYLCIWDVMNGQVLIRLYGHKGLITSVHWISDHRIASSSKDRTIKIWEILEA